MSTNSWQEWLAYLTASGSATDAAICSLQDGQPLASTAGYGLQPAEVTAVTAHFGSPETGLAQKGGHFVGNYYVFVQGLPHREIYFRRGSEGVAFCQCAKCDCVIVATHGSDIQAGPCRSAIGTLADRMSGTLPTRDSGRWPTVIDPNDKSSRAMSCVCGCGSAPGSLSSKCSMRLKSHVRPPHCTSCE